MKELLEQAIEKEEFAARKALLQYMVDSLEMGQEDAEDMIRALEAWLSWRDLKGRYCRKSKGHSFP